MNSLCIAKYRSAGNLSMRSNRGPQLPRQNAKDGSTVGSQVGREIGGAERDRTAGLLVANEALSQLSYSPTTHSVYQWARNPQRVRPALLNPGVRPWLKYKPDRR